MVIHAFGGYYGLAISWVLYRPNLHQSKRLNGSVYHSDVFAMIGEHLARPPSPCLFHHFTCFFLSSNRDSVPLDVLAQFQLRHHRPRRRTAQSGHQHLPGFGLLRPHHRCHLQHARQARKARHGGPLSDEVSITTVFQITNMRLSRTGAHPERHARRRRRHGNSS